MTSNDKNNKYFNQSNTDQIKNKFNNAGEATWCLLY